MEQSIPRLNHQTNPCNGKMEFLDERDSKQNIELGTMRLFPTLSNQLEREDALPRCRLRFHDIDACSQHHIR